MHKIYRFNEDRLAFGNKLKALMADNGYTIDSLSSDLYGDVLISINTIKKWRSGERIPDIDTINRLANKFNVSMQELYMPNSVYDNPICEELNLFLERKISFSELSLGCIKELERYSEFLFQKLLFSFLSFKERNTLNALFECYQITDYGMEKLDINGDATFVDFYDKTRKYIKKEFGQSLPYKIDSKQSKQIYLDFEKMIEIKSEGVK